MEKNIYLFLALAVLLIPFYFIWQGNKERDAERLKKLAERKTISPEKFIKYFEEKGFKKETVRELYDELQSYSGNETPLNPDDDLCEVFNIDIEELESIAENIFRKTHGREITKSEIKKFNPEGKRMTKFEEVLIFISGKF